ncbi:hypothetical protein MMC10_000690 [Thelotrema lepadinum]|nr:hypothetical protein [Thelotrema lepadinum]
MENLSEIARIQEAEREAIQEELERGGKRLEEIQVMEIEALTRQNEFSYRYWQYEQKLMVTLSHELEQIKSEFPSGHYKFLEEVRSNFDEMDEEWRRRSREEDRVSTGLKLFRSVFHSAGLADKNVGFPSSTRQPQIKAGEEVEEEGSKKNRKGERQRLRRQRKRALKRESRAGEYDNQQEDDISIGADLLRVYQRSPGPETTKPVIDHLLASIDRLRTRDPYIDDSHKGLSESLAKIAYKDDQVRRTAASTLSREELQQYSAAIFYLLDSLKLKSFASGHRRDRNGFEYLQWVWCLVGHIEVRLLGLSQS